jgi:hypothetical protein
MLVYMVHNVQLDEHFLSALERDCPVAAAIVEPIQAEGGECTGGVNVDRPHPLLHVQVTDMHHQSISEVCSQYVRRWVLHGFWVSLVIASSPGTLFQF